MKVAKDLVAASATPMVLGILAEGESYGYAILRRINELSGGELDWTEGLLYPLLHRLERLGHVESSWRATAGERRRKYYRITDAGKAELAEQRRQWAAVVDTLKEVWQGLGDHASLLPAPALPAVEGLT
jgi:PadR family transcriptional regulator, regulatory protein PadR